MEQNFIFPVNVTSHSQSFSWRKICQNLIVFDTLNLLNIRIICLNLVTRRGTSLMETGLLHDYFGNFSMRSERYYFLVEGSMQEEIEMNLGNGRWGRLKQTSENSEGWRGVLDLHKSGNELSLDLDKSGNELSLDLHKLGNELSLDLHKSGNELSLDLHINESPKWKSSLLDFL